MIRDRERRAEEPRSLAGLFGDLWRETTALVHDEVQLLKVDVSEKIGELTGGMIAIAVGGAIVFAGFLVLLFAAVGALELVLATEHAIWLAPLIVGLAVMIAGVIALAAGLAELRSRGARPERSLRSLREDARMLKEHAR